MAECFLEWHWRQLKEHPEGVLMGWRRTSHGVISDQAGGQGSCFHSFIYLILAALDLHCSSLVVAGGDYSMLCCTSFSLQWLLLYGWSTAALCVWASESLQHSDSLVVATGLVAVAESSQRGGIVSPDWQADSYLCAQGSQNSYL